LPPFLYTALILADFHEQGSLPVDREDLNINARGVDTWDASSFNT